MTNRRGVQFWTEQLTQSDIPAFSYSIAEINRQCNAQGSSATELASVILKDASLTSTILKIANSVHYNPQNKKPITTVSRAVVMLGFSGIKSILVTTMFIEHVMKNKDKGDILECLATCIHRAVQAKFLLSHTIDATDEKLEEAFIYGLIYDLAEIAFRTGSYPELEKINQPKAKTEAQKLAVQTDVLGTSFKKISHSLVKHWQLGTGVEEIFLFDNKEQHSHTSHCINIANKICQAAKGGWGSSEMDESLQLAAGLIGTNAEDTLVLLKDKANAACEIAGLYGCDELSELIPCQTPTASNQGLQDNLSNPSLLLELLREIHSLKHNGTDDINSLFHLLLEGIHRGIGMERVALFTIDPKVTEATLKYAVGDNISNWKQGKIIPIASNDTDIFSYSIHHGRDLWLTPDQEQPWLSMISLNKLDDFDTNNGLISTIFAKGKPIVLLVSDRGVQGDLIDSSQHESFCYFSEQASAALQNTAEQNTPKVY